MKIQYMSDLHLEFGDMETPTVVGDVLVLAGDIHLGTKAIPWVNKCAEVFDHVIYLSGNHEFYRNDIKLLPKKIVEEGNLSHSEGDEDIYELLSTNVHFLDNNFIDINGVRFIGTTLWSDITDYAASRMNDFRLISNITRTFSGQDARDLHTAAIAFINDSLCEGTNVLVTHHCPSIKCINTDRYGEDDPISAGYYTDILGQFEDKVTAWISGHTHGSWNFTDKGIDVLGNCRGYKNYEENPDFNEEATYELDAIT
jgi:predicted phosphohydrolase